MKNLRILFFIALPLCSHSQDKWQKGGNTNNGGSQTTCGTAAGWNQPFQLMTQGMIRMHINQTGTSAGGTNTSGFIGIGTSNPYSPLHIVGNQNQALVGWRRGLTLSNSAAIVWDGVGGSGFMMAHPSSNPNGNFYAGVLNNLNINSPVNYAFTVHVNQLLGGNPQASTQFYKNLLVYDGNTERSFGVNVVTPSRVSEIFDGGSNNNTDAQLRLSTITNKYTDFRTTSFGNLLINPVNGKVAINSFNDPTTTLDVNGDARIRNVQTAVPDALFVGVQAGGLGDLNVRRLDFTGNASQVLLGNGTWGTIGSGIGTCAVPTVLTTSAAIDLNNQNFNFLRNGTGNSNLVNIGEPCATPFLLYRAKLNVLQTGWTTFDLGPFTLKTVVAGRFNASASTPNNHVSIGVLGIADGSSANYGVVGVAPSGVNDRAGYFVGDLETTAAAVITSDQQFKTDVLPIKSALDILSKLVPRTYYLDTLNYKHFNFGSEKQYGFIAQELETVLPELVHNSIHIGSVDSIGNVIGERTEYKSLNYNAIIPINTQAINELNQKFERATLSDGTIKSNVQDLTGSLAKVLLMRGVDYDWNGTNHPNLQLDSSNHIGFIAQEINAIDSRLTFIDEDTLMHVGYEKVVPILAEAIGELNQIVEAKDSIIVVLQNENLAQQSQINDLNARLTLLENCLSNILPALCNANQMAVQQTPEEVQQQLRAAINVNLSDRNAIVLNQNVPNPFAESTVITFTIPGTVQKAQIHFYDGTGKLINSVDIVERGNGQLNVFANDLSTGVYIYSLVADGQIVSTKRMMKQ